MQKLNPSKVGLTLGSLIGLVHLVWSILVALGWAQGLVNFISWAHMMQEPLAMVAPFNAGTAVLLVVITFIVGYVLGTVFALIWNNFAGKN